MRNLAVKAERERRGRRTRRAGSVEIHSQWERKLRE
jgi:hypothetical protein